jgi:signal transduction histidine kinase
VSARTPGMDSSTKAGGVIARLRQIPPLLWDGALALLLLGAAAAHLSTPYTGPRPLVVGGWIAFLFSALALLPLAVRRRFPFSVLLIAAGVGLVGPIFDLRDTTAQAVGLTIATYSVIAYGRTWQAVIGASLAVAVYWQHVNPGIAPWAVTYYNYLFLALVVYAGYVQNRRLAVGRSLARRREELEEQRERLAQLAVADERSRIARELHAVVAKGVQAMVGIAAAGGKAVGHADSRSQEEVGRIESSGRQALVEMRRLLGVIRGDGPVGAPGDRAPQPRLDDLPGLVERVREAGLPVSYAVDGHPDSVPAGVEVCVYRIVQEALSNVVRHCGAVPAHVDVRISESALDVDVQNAPSRHPQPPTPGGAGRGLAGMRERVAVFDGRLETGPLPGGGFAVHAVLPLGRR